jgi:GTP-binding protein
MVANKWDLIEGKHTNIQKEVTKELHKSFPFFTWVPIVFTSALSGQHVQKLFKTIQEVARNRAIEVDQDFLDDFITKATKKHKPIASIGIRRPVIKEFTQVQKEPPVFRVVIRPKDSLAQTYVRYLENLLRQELGIQGTKLWITVKK